VFNIPEAVVYLLILAMAAIAYFNAITKKAN
jgi:hypothetical protein